MDQVEEVKQKTDIVSLIGDYIQLQKAGRNYKALCPFHSEKTPSFMVSGELQIYKCFGCNESGDVFTFLEKYEGMEFREALKFLADRAQVKLIFRRGDQTSEKDKFYEINLLTAKFYNYILLSHPRGKYALNYLVKERGLNLDTIKTFQLGFSPDVPGVLERVLVEKKKYDPRLIERIGLVLIKDGRIYERFRGRIIFPLFDHRGNVAGFAGRVLPHPRYKDLAKYINTPETLIYHKGNLLYGLNLTKGEIKTSNEVVVVEGELDLISSWQKGVRNVVAIKGSALTDDQVRLLGRFTKTMVLALDSDLAGDSASRRGVVIAQNEGFEIKVARFPKFKDPDEAARGDPVAFKKAIKEAEGVWDFLIDSVFSRHDSKTGEGKAKISREIVPILGTISDKIVQAHYSSLVAKRLNVPEEAVLSQLNQLGQEPKDKLGEILVKTIEKNRRVLLEERLLTLCFQSDPKKILNNKIKKLIVTPLSKRILEEYETYSESHPSFSPTDFVEILPKELVSGFSEMILKDTEGLVEDSEAFSRELILVIRELEIVHIRQALESLGVKIRQYEEDKEAGKLKDAQERFSNLTQRLSVLEEGEKRGIILQEA